MNDIISRSRSAGECGAAFSFLSRLKAICSDIGKREREAAEIIVQLHAFGMSERKIAAEIGRSDTWVHRLRDWAARRYEGTPFGPQSKEARTRKAAYAPKQAEAADNVVQFPTSEPDANDAQRAKENADADAHAASLIKLIGAKHAGLAFEFLESILRDNPFLALKIIRAGKQCLRRVRTVTAGRR
jgi:hypothetical protein